MTRAILCLVALALLLLTAACGSSLTVRHLDPTYESVYVYVGEGLVGNLHYGDSVTVRLKPGEHVVRARPAVEAINPWAGDEGVWRFILGKEATLTLLPPTDEWP